jgi:3'-5' exoribonuclease
LQRSFSFETSSNSPGSPRHASIAQLRKGDQIADAVYLVEVANFKQTRNNKHFIQLVLRDRSGSIKAVRWEASQELYNSFTTEDFLKIRGRVEEYQQNLQIVVDDLAAVPPESVDFEEFLPMAERKPEEMERELLQEIASIRDAHLKALLLAFVEDQEIRKGLLRCPAGKALHHAYVGGLLEHILSLMGAAKLLVKNYPKLNLDMLLTAALLHDIGKIRELSYTRSFNYTDEGQLVGHIGIGLLLLAEKAKAVPDFPPELLIQIQHIIASHHGIPEHGAIKHPMTPEAIVFHYLDDLDAKLAMLDGLEKELHVSSEATETQRRWTEFKPSLGRRIFFPG